MRQKSGIFFKIKWPNLNHRFCAALFAFFCACQAANAAKCSAGYYLSGGTCTACKSDVEAYYCPGDDVRHACPTTNTNYSALGCTVIGGREDSGSRQGTGATDPTHCWADLFCRDPNGNEFLSENNFNGTNYWGDVKFWYAAATGYYLSPYWWTSYKVWYQGVKACTNKPANSYYTGAGTPDSADGSVKDANDCPWGCNSGYYKNGSSCTSCTNVTWTDSGTDTGTDTSGCTATSQTITVSISNGSYKQNQTRSGSRTWSQSKSRTCYRTGGAGGTNGSSACTGTGCGSYSYGNKTYGSCSYGSWSNSGSAYGYSCNSNYYLSGTACYACTGVSFTDTGTDTSGCTATSQTITVSISNGSYKQNQTRTGSRSGTRTCYRTGGAGGTNGSSACTGTGNCGGWSYNSCSYGSWSNSGSGYEYKCDPGYYLSASGTSCLACSGNKWYCPGDNKWYDVSAGYYTTGGTSTTRTGQAQCPAGSYCADGEKHDCPSDYPLTDPSGASYSEETSIGDCWRNCNASDVPNSTARTGWKEQNGNNTCKATACATGYYLDGTACTKCPTSHPNSPSGNTGGISSCYATCSDISVTNGTDKANATTVYHPSSCTYTRTCNSGHNLTYANNCAKICDSGITHLRTSSDVSVLLYAVRQTTPAINVLYNGTVCYGNLVTGASSGALNIRKEGTAYHSVN